MARFNTPASSSAQKAGQITTTGTTTNHAGGAGFTRDAKGELFLLAAVNMVGQDTFYESASNLATLRKGAATPSVPWLHDQDRSRTLLQEAEGRDARFSRLVREVAVSDPNWLLRMVGWLRHDANMRTASIVMAAEAIKARLDDPSTGEQFLARPRGTNKNVWCGSRAFATAAISRGDEPGEFLAYWAAKYGKKPFPKPVKRGVADALLAVMSEYGYAKYGRSEGSSWGWGDVAEMVRPDHTRAWCVGVASGDGLEGTAVRCTARGVWLDRVSRPWCEEHYQEALAECVAKGTTFPVSAVAARSDLIRHAINERHGRDAEIPESLTLLRKRKELLAWPQEDRRAFLSRPGSVQVLSDAGITWEALSGWLGGPLDAAFWEAVIPTMGYMALLRNLRNFEQAQISVRVRKLVADRLADPVQVARSRQLPFRFLSAYKAVTGDHYSSALSDALDASVGTLPRFPGRTLVLVDTSGSMQSPISQKSSVTHLDIGALFGAALAQRGIDAGDSVDLYGFADGIFRHELPRGGSILKGIASLNARVGSVGYGTQTVAALQASYNGHDRVILVTDMQAFAYGGHSTRVTVSDAVPAGVPMYGINPGGYASTALDLSKPNRFEIGGFSDKVFSMMALLGQGESFEYPF